MNRRKLWLGYVLLLLSVSAQANGVDPTLPSQVFATRLGTLVSSPGEVEDAFAMRVAHRMRVATWQSNRAVCGRLCVSHAQPHPERVIGVHLFTTDSHQGCLVPNVCPAGLLPTTGTVMGYVPSQGFRATPVDVVFLQAAGQPAQVRDWVTRVSGFSQLSVDVGPGFMVEGRGVWRQTGNGTEVLIGLLDTRTLP